MSSFHIDNNIQAECNSLQVNPGLLLTSIESTGDYLVLHSVAKELQGSPDTEKDVQI